MIRAGFFPWFSSRCEIMNKIKYLALGVAGSLGSVLCAAEGDPDFSAATTALTSIKDALADWVGSAMPIVIAVATAFLGFWLVKFAIRVIKSFAGAGK